MVLALKYDPDQNQDLLGKPQYLPCHSSSYTDSRTAAVICETNVP